MFTFCFVGQGKVARSVVMPIGMQSVLKSIPVSGTFLFFENMVMKIFFSLSSDDSNRTTFKRMNAK